MRRSPQLFITRCASFVATVFAAPLLTATLLARAPAAAQEVVHTQRTAQKASAQAPEGAQHKESPSLQKVAPYVGLSWRVLGLANHVSNGPGFEAGALLFEHLRIGFAGFARPGPINRKIFDYELPEGQSYKGQRTLNLRSDGSLLGLQLSPVFRLGARDTLAGRFEIETPLILGYGAFGFYLHGDDRDTPDGRRVSAWENELLDGMDAGGGFGIDAGLRISMDLYRGYLRLFASANYTAVVPYETAVRDSYQGFSGALGLELRGVRRE